MIRAMLPSGGGGGAPPVAGRPVAVIAVGQTQSDGDAKGLRALLVENYQRLKCSIG
jgi:hypothetical protein